jgi:Family of unknown function (DUF5329)
MSVRRTAPAPSTWIGRRMATRSLLGLGLPFGMSSLLGLTLTTHADAQPRMTLQSEVNHLIAAIGQSGCIFFRNGNWHNAEEVQVHLRSKYDYLLSFGQVSTTEEFIDKAATQSSLSGQAYRVKCGDGMEMLSRDWMREQLKLLRARR